jgi:RND family efflux transporter MFP subunit
VQVCRPIVRELRDFEEFTGRTDASRSAVIRAQVSGMLTKVAYPDGKSVKEGDLLFEIDPRPYQAELDKADAEVRRAEARLKKKTAELRNMRSLSEKKVVSRLEVDLFEIEHEEMSAALDAARAGRDLARQTIGYCRIVAPFSGRLGRTQLDAGNVVVAYATQLAFIRSQSPAFVLFDVDERTIRQLNAMRRAGTFPDGVGGGSALSVRIGLADDRGFPHRGTVDIEDSRPDPNTGTAQFRAVVPDPDQALVPGLFARIRVTTSAPHKAMLIPEQAVVTDQGRKFVFVVPVRTIQKRPVKIGAFDDGFRVVTEGVTEDDRVIVSNLGRIKEGMTIDPQEVAPPMPQGSEPGR